VLGPPDQGVQERRSPVTSRLPTIVVTSGEPAGIGLDICLALGQRDVPARLAVLADPAALAARAQRLGAAVSLRTHDELLTVPAHARGTLHVLAVPAGAPVTPGRLDTANAAYVLDMLRLAVRLTSSGEAEALVTAPVQKSVLAESGVPFSGHTEFLAELTGTARPVMLLAGRAARVALATTHLPLRRVADAIDAALLDDVLRITDDGLRRRFRIDRPRLLVLGLNPHAGESGTLGTEEIAVIAPAVRRARAAGLDVVGPVSADTAFTAESLGRCDAVVAMYHDQGLPPLKALSFGEIVNVTLGLPILRTSVDHGTALPLAGTGRARPASLFAAVELALTLA
jgi:4-hydroxythreonine-4-phosphate dehydrogenase